MNTLQAIIDQAFSELAGEALEQDVRHDQMIAYLCGMRDMRDEIMFKMEKLNRRDDENELQQDDR